MSTSTAPPAVLSWINGKEFSAAGASLLRKVNPYGGTLLTWATVTTNRAER
jgi:hypothetical protein